MPNRIYFGKPEYGSIGVGSLVWRHSRTYVIEGPFHVVEIRHAGYGNGAHKKWILFDSYENEYHPASWGELRIPKECIKEEE